MGGVDANRLVTHDAAKPQQPLDVSCVATYKVTMDTTTARGVVKAMATIRDSLRDASEAERQVIAADLRRLLARAEGDAKPFRKVGTPTAIEINEAARSVLAAGGGFGENKAFICEVYERLNPAMSLPAFKTLLLSLLQAGSVTICRADLVEVMDLAKITLSEIKDLGATFHFVWID